MEVSFIGGGNQSTVRKPPTCRKLLTNFITPSSIADTGKFWKILEYKYLPVSVPVLQILEDTGKILVLPVLCTSIVVPASRPAASYYPIILVHISDSTHEFLNLNFWCLAPLSAIF